MLKQLCVVLAVVAAASCAAPPDKETLLRLKEAIHNNLSAVKQHSRHTGLLDTRKGAEVLAYEEQIIAFLEQLQELMRAPIGFLGNATLDPLEVSEINLDIDNSLMLLQGYLQNVTVNNLSQFTPVSASFNIVGFSLTVEIFFEEITASGYYNITGDLIDLLLIYGDGPFTASVRNVSIAIDVAIKSEDDIPYIDTLGIDYNIPIIQTNLTNLLGGGDLSDVANAILSDLVPEVLDTFKDEILGAIEPAIIEVVNQALSNYTLEGIICLIVGLFC